MQTFNRNSLAAAALCTGLLSAPAQAAVDLTFDNPASVGLGEVFDLDVVVAGLDSTDLAGFDFDVVFDEGIVGFQGYTLGSELTDPVLGQFDLSALSNPPGEVNLAEVSWVPAPPSDGGFFSAQPDAFALATLTFEALAVGSTDFDFRNVALSDAFGNEIVAAAVPGQVAVVPLPGAAFLFAGALATLGVLRRRSRS